MYEFCAETLACHLMQGVDIPVLFNTQSHYSPHRYSRESLKTTGSFIKMLKVSPIFKRTLKQRIDYACRALLARNILHESKIWVA